jgi:hypothetical protein
MMDLTISANDSIHATNGTSFVKVNVSFTGKEYFSVPNNCKVRTIFREKILLTQN